MPTYEYECPDCEHRFEAFQKISADPITDCPECGGSNVRRLISASAFHLKGSGWYKTDYSSSNSNGGTGEKSASSTSNESTTSSETSKGGTSSEKSAPAASKSESKGSSDSSSTKAS